MRATKAARPDLALQMEAEASLKKLPFAEEYRTLNLLSYLTQKQSALETMLQALLSESDIGLTSDHPVLQKISETASHLEGLQSDLLRSTDVDEAEKLADEKDKTTNDMLALSGEIHLSIASAEAIAARQKQLSEIRAPLESAKKFFMEAYDDLHALYLNDTPTEKKHSPWIIHVYENFVTAHPECFDEKNVGLFLDYLLEVKKTFLPEDYFLGDVFTPGEAKFPGSKTQRDDFGFAHFQPCTAIDAHENAGLLASSAPFKKSIREFNLELSTENEQTEQKFLEMLFTKQVRYALELGSNFQKRLDYTHVTSGEFRSSMTTDGLITITQAKTGKTHELQLVHFDVEDQKPLFLSNHNLEALASLYEAYKQSVILVHCDSGVGRTGQIRLMFSMIDKLSHDNALAQSFLSLLATPEHSEKTMKDIFLLMVNTLNELRSVRYCIEQPEQFIAAFGQTLLLLTTKQLQENPLFEKETLDAIREELKIPVASVISSAAQREMSRTDSAASTSSLQTSESASSPETASRSDSLENPAKKRGSREPSTSSAGTEEMTASFLEMDSAASSITTLPSASSHLETPTPPNNPEALTPISSASMEPLELDPTNQHRLFQPTAPSAPKTTAEGSRFERKQR